MKVQDLFEAMGYDPERKIPTGSVKEWLAAMGATPEDIAAARAEVLESPEYQTLIDRGMKDSSTERAKKNGTIILTMEYDEPVMKRGYIDRKTGEPASDEEVAKVEYPDLWKKYKIGQVGKSGNKVRKAELHYNIQPHGKIDFTAPNGYHRWPAASGKTALVKGNPKASIVKSMKNALVDLDRQVMKRLQTAKKQFAADVAK
jgi:hypothetical protein